MSNTPREVLEEIASAAEELVMAFRMGQRGYFGAEQLGAQAADKLEKAVTKRAAFLAAEAGK